MRYRGAHYWAWADCQLHSQEHEESLESGITLDVKARLSRSGCTQLFLGVYTSAGLPIVEEYHDHLDEVTLTRAIIWGVKRCRAIAADVIELNELPAISHYPGMRAINSAP
ncbi:hypothetical protein D3C76_629740 [compost metagenome]|jgi:hypothetical protein|uniref:Uncharacterized protein n=1 Tax=Pseudomonas wadenswilerensis TaxID=1785161 RepID=A0A380SZR7_9PSED|nr:hypothetical protein [Pseudomonas]MCE5984477.1 hypothetical protein [Pseudomonas sp. LF19]UVM19851.1 hypothetical protein LOY45_15435 [Pseudomonas wadenswilerensis]SPO66945.1 conserved protein of unknown function [Pseudomonas sp. JV241A]SUQ63479.1 hypothetical protein CCOS864_02930 [Pseudomonas wadenswilerensis]